MKKNWQIDYSRWELFFMRLLFALALAYSLRSNWPSKTSQPEPNGLAHWIDFSFLGQSSVLSVLEPIYWCCLLAYVLGFLPVAGLAFASFFRLGIGTLSNSQGSIGHSTQLMTMVLIAQWLVYAWGAARDRKEFLRPTRATHNLTIDWSMVVIAAGYTVSGVVKLMETDGKWIARTPYLSLQLIKSNAMDYYNRLEQTPDFWAVTIPEVIVKHPWLAWIMFGTGLLLEVFCFLVMLGRRWALAFGLALVFMHLTISRIMRLTFEDHIALLLIFFVNVPFWIMLWRTGRRPSASQSAGDSACTAASPVKG
jgi:hypothetical protein